MSSSDRQGLYVSIIQLTLDVGQPCEFQQHIQKQRELKSDLTQRIFPVDERLALHFPDFFRIAGEVLQGQVDVNVPTAKKDNIKNVRVKLRGAIVTYVDTTK